MPQISYLTRNEIQGILAAIQHTSWAEKRNQVLLLYMYNTGSRVQEVADARLPWLSLHGPHKVEILGKGNKVRVCPLWETTARALEHYLKERNQLECPTDHLFLNRSCRPLSRSGITYIIDSCVQKAASAMPSLRNKRVTPHTIRHTTAMHLLQSGVEMNVIKSWLGHASVATTDRYVQIDLEMKTRALETCEIAGDRKRRRRVTPELLSWLEAL